MPKGMNQKLKLIYLIKIMLEWSYDGREYRIKLCTYSYGLKRGQVFRKPKQNKFAIPLILC